MTSRYVVKMRRQLRGPGGAIESTTTVIVVSPVEDKPTTKGNDQ